MKLPVDRHLRELTKLATTVDEDIATLRKEFEEFIGLEVGDAVEKTAPWPEPVDTATLLQECGDKIRKHVVVQPHQLTAAAVWTAHAWLYDHGVVMHSPILAATSPEPDSGKSTVIAVVGFMSPRFSATLVELTGPSLFHYVDAVKPTVVIDEADNVFTRKTDLAHVINAGWTKNAKVPRAGAHYSVFTPKCIALLGRNLPTGTRSRCIELRMQPKRLDENVADFRHQDDVEFAVLRRKFKRWSNDHAAALQTTRPEMPTGFGNRMAANWNLLLAIAELAGGDWPEQAKEAAERLAHSGRRPSDGVRLLAAFRAVFGAGKTEITSAAMVAELIADPTSVWVAYHRGGAITQRQIAILLDGFDIHPVSLHPTRKKDFARQGYKLSQFIDAFARYLPLEDPIIQSPERAQPKSKKSKPKKSKKRGTR
jgi:putative DNA primase/helicase